MTQPIVRSGQSVDLAVRDLAEMRRFLDGAWHLDLVAEERGRAYFRASGPQFSVLNLRQAERSGLVRITLEAITREAVDLAYGRIVAAALATDGSPRRLSTP